MELNLQSFKTLVNNVYEDLSNLPANSQVFKTFSRRASANENERYVSQRFILFQFWFTALDNAEMHFIKTILASANNFVRNSLIKTRVRISYFGKYRRNASKILVTN